MDKHAGNEQQRGMALVVVLLISAIFLVLAGALLMMSQSQRSIAVNDEDFLKALQHTESGLAWAGRRIGDTTDLSALLEFDDDPGTSNDDDPPDELLGLRDLSLTSTGQFTNANENTASAVVSRDFFGDGARKYEAIRLEGSASSRALANDPATRAMVYMRIDDNQDDAPTSPTVDDPRVDSDGVIRVTAVTEYPVFVDAQGREVDIAHRRPKAQRRVVATFGKGVRRLPAVGTNGDLGIPGNLKLCGDCGSLHSNQDVAIAGSPQVCEDVTANGRVSGRVSGIAGSAQSNAAHLDLPVINPYDSLFMPTPDTFDTSADTGLPLGLRCPRASATDPGANKFFALVSDGDRGRVFKAYWNFASGGWSWTQIDDLADGINTVLDDCGRVQGVDTNYGAGSAGDVNDGANNEFYGFIGSSITHSTCSSCGTAGADDTLCSPAFNDFGTQAVLGGPHRLPGAMAVDGALDMDPATRPNGSPWSFPAGRVWSPLYGSVLFVYGHAQISGTPGGVGSDFRCSAGAACPAGFLPYGLFKTSIIATGDLVLAGQVSIGPANPAQGYHFQMIAGRDLVISGNPSGSVTACDFGCTVTVPARIDHMAAIWAAHEQIRISGNANLIGVVLAEDAADCSSTVNGAGRGLSEIDGTPRLMYDCNHPPNPWDRSTDVRLLSWREIE